MLYFFLENKSSVLGQSKCGHTYKYIISSNIHNICFCFGSVCFTYLSNLNKWNVDQRTLSPQKQLMNQMTSCYLNYNVWLLGHFPLYLNVKCLHRDFARVQKWRIDRHGEGTPSTVNIQVSTIDFSNVTKSFKMDDHN